MAQASGPKITGIGQVFVATKDQERAIGFYRDVLGLPFLFQVPGMAFFTCGEVRLLLGPPERPEFDHPASILYYRVADIRSAFRTLQERGAAVEHEPRLTHKDERHELWLAFLRDSEGNPFALMSELPLGG